MSSTVRVDRRAVGFRPGRALTVLWILATAVLLSLGTWQLRRLAWKTELIQRAETGLALPARPLRGDVAVEPDFSRVVVDGTFIPGTALALGLVSREGRPGARLLGALRLADGRTLLVDQGWIAEGRLAAALSEPPPAGPQRLQGVVRREDGGGVSWFVPAPDLRVPRWYALDLKAIGDRLGLRLEPVWLVLESCTVQGGARPEPVRVELRNPHLGYAVTWFGLAAALLVFYISLGLERRKGS